MGFPEIRLDMVKKTVLFKNFAQIFDYVFLLYFRENRKHRSRSAVVLIIPTVISFEDRGGFCNHGASMTFPPKF